MVQRFVTPYGYRAWEGVSEAGIDWTGHVRLSSMMPRKREVKHASVPEQGIKGMPRKGRRDCPSEDAVVKGGRDGAAAELETPLGTSDEILESARFLDVIPELTSVDKSMRQSSSRSTRVLSRYC